MSQTKALLKGRDHAVHGCPEWKKPQQSTKFLGSASKVLGFFHVDVESRPDRVNHWANVDNCGSEVTKEEIIRNLQKIFDKDWSWCIRELGEYSYSVRFPPDSKVESIVFGGTTYFYLDKEGVMVSLKAWSGEVQPVEELVDTWVTVRGVPPKWNDWETIQQIASSLGMFEVVIIKVAVRDPTKIPRTRLMEMAKKIYLISFKVEGAEQVGGGNNPDNFDDDDLLGDDQGMEESDTNSKMDTDKSQTPSNTESKRKRIRGLEAVKTQQEVRQFLCGLAYSERLKRR
ncbi:hypothetical protein EJB05_37046, partial [Eragrostis curvula]